MSHPATLAQGAALTPETFADFVTRLKHHCQGEGVSDHCTADAIFNVQARRIIFGIDRDYTDQVAIYHEERYWFSTQAYWDDCCEEEQAALNDAAQSYDEAGFLALDEDDRLEIIAKLDGHYVSGWDEKWETINAHYTKEAAEAFIARKKHDYRDGLRVYVNAQIYCWEWNAIKAALMDGRLVLAQGEGEGA